MSEAGDISSADEMEEEISPLEEQIGEASFHSSARLSSSTSSLDDAHSQGTSDGPAPFEDDGSDQELLADAAPSEMHLAITPVRRYSTTPDGSRTFEGVGALYLTGSVLRHVTYPDSEWDRCGLNGDSPCCYRSGFLSSLAGGGGGQSHRRRESVWSLDISEGGVVIWLVRAPDEFAFKRAPPSTEPTTLLVLPAANDTERETAARLAAHLGIWSAGATLADEEAPRLALLAASAILRSGALTARGLRGCADLITTGLETALEVFRRNVGPVEASEIVGAHMRGAYCMQPDGFHGPTSASNVAGAGIAGAAPNQPGTASGAESKVGAGAPQVNGWAPTGLMHSSGMETGRTFTAIAGGRVFTRRVGPPSRIEAAIEGVSTVARAAEGITYNASHAVGMAATRAGAAAAERLQLVVHPSQPSRMGAAIRAIGGASVAAAREVLDAIGQTGAQVSTCTAAAASDAVSHRYGEDAGRVTYSALNAFGSTACAVQNVASLGRRGLATSVAKNAASGVAKTVAADDEWEEWPNRMHAPPVVLTASSPSDDADFLIVSVPVSPASTAPATSVTQRVPFPVQKQTAVPSLAASAATSCTPTGPSPSIPITATATATASATALAGSVCPELAAPKERTGSRGKARGGKKKKSGTKGGSR